MGKSKFENYQSTDDSTSLSKDYKHFGTLLYSLAIDIRTASTISPKKRTIKYYQIPNIIHNIANDFWAKGVYHKIEVDKNSALQAEITLLKAQLKYAIAQATVYEIREYSKNRYEGKKADKLLKPPKQPRAPKPQRIKLTEEEKRIHNNESHRRRYAKKKEERK